MAAAGDQPQVPANAKTNAVGAASIAHSTVTCVLAHGDRSVLPDVQRLAAAWRSALPAFGPTDMRL